MEKGIDCQTTWPVRANPLSSTKFTFTFSPQARESSPIGSDRLDGLSPLSSTRFTLQISVTVTFLGEGLSPLENHRATLADVGGLLEGVT
jgi:hypothetical protein